jgi:hypothetical protein
MATIKVRHLISRTFNRHVVYYWQPSARLRGMGWAPQRLPDDLSLAIAQAEALNLAVDASRTAIAAAAPAKPTQLARDPRSIDALIALYRKSEDWARLAPATRRGYAQCLERIQLWAGPAPVAAIDWPRIDKLSLRLQATPAMRNAVLRVLRLLLGRAKKLGWVAANAAERPGLHGLAPSGLIWPREAVAAFVTAADALGRHSIGTAVMLNEWIGQREGDVLRLPRSIWRAGSLQIRQSKTGVAVSLPIDAVPALSRRLADELARIDAHGWLATPAQLIVDESNGHAYSADRFRHLFAAIRDDAAELQPSFAVDYLLPGRRMEDPDAFTVRMTDLWFMHLRHTAVTRLEEAECDLSLIAAVTGHSHKSILTIIERYGRRTRKLAHLAFTRRLAAEAGTMNAPPDEADRGG